MDLLLSDDELRELNRLAAPGGLRDYLDQLRAAKAVHSNGTLTLECELSFGRATVAWVGGRLRATPVKGRPPA